MKRKLMAIITASLLTLGGLSISPAYSNDNTKEQHYTTCIERYKNMTPGKDYVEGNIIIGFEEGITREAAKQFIENYNKNKELEIIRYWNDFDKTGWTTVKVPKGKEIEYACSLDSLSLDETVIKFAIPNIIAGTGITIIVTPKSENGEED